jgi:acyl carrier protein
VANVDALVLLLDRYLAWGRIDLYENLSAAVEAFRTEQGDSAVRDAREAIDWISGERFPDGGLVDSLGLVELIMEVEDRYGDRIADDDAETLPELLERVRPLLD